MNQLAVTHSTRLIFRSLGPHSIINQNLYFAIRSVLSQAFAYRVMNFLPRCSLKRTSFWKELSMLISLFKIFVNHSKTKH